MCKMEAWSGAQNIFRDFAWWDATGIYVSYYSRVRDSPKEILCAVWCGDDVVVDGVEGSVVDGAAPCVAGTVVV